MCRPVSCTSRGGPSRFLELLHDQLRAPRGRSPRRRADRVVARRRRVRSRRRAIARGAAHDRRRRDRHERRAAARASGGDARSCSRPASTTATARSPICSPGRGGRRSARALAPDDRVRRVLDLRTGPARRGRCRRDARCSRCGSRRSPGRASPCCAPTSIRPTLRAAHGAATDRVLDRRRRRLRRGWRRAAPAGRSRRRRGSSATGARLDRIAAYVAGAGRRRARSRASPASTTRARRRLRRVARRTPARVVAAMGGAPTFASTATTSSRLRGAPRAVPPDGVGRRSRRGGGRRARHHRARVPRSRVLGRRPLRAPVPRGDASPRPRGRCSSTGPNRLPAALARPRAPKAVAARASRGSRRRADSTSRRVRAATRAGARRSDPHRRGRGAHRRRRRLGGVLLRRLDRRSGVRGRARPSSSSSRPRATGRRASGSTARARRTSTA